MKLSLKLIPLLFALILISCGEKQDKNKPVYAKKTVKKVVKTPPSVRVDLKNKGIGPITSIDLGNKVDQEMASYGAAVFKNLCTACHRSDKKFIGPSPKNILSRRTPEWIMNMILNPNEMVQKDPLAKDLLIEFNGSPMADQSVTKEDARAILEYFRTLN